MKENITDKPVQMVCSAQNVENGFHHHPFYACTVGTTRGNFHITVVSVEKDSPGKGTTRNTCVNIKAEVMLVNTAHGCSKVPWVYGTICRNILEDLDSHVIPVVNSIIFKTSMSNI